MADRFCRAAITLSGQNIDPTKWKIMWNNKFIDVARVNQCRVVNYPTALRDAGQIMGTAGFSLKSIKPATFMPALEASVQTEDDKVMHIVPWDEDEKHLPLDEQGDVAVVVDIDGVPLVKVNNSDAYHKAVTNEAAKEKKERERKEKRERKGKGKTKKQRGHPLPSPQPGSPSPHLHRAATTITRSTRAAATTCRALMPPPLPFPQEYAQPLDYAYHAYIPPHGYLPDVSRYEYKYPPLSGGYPYRGRSPQRAGPSHASHPRSRLPCGRRLSPHPPSRARARAQSSKAAASRPQRGPSIPAIPRPPQSKGAAPESQCDVSRHESRWPHVPETVRINFENLGAGAGRESAGRSVDVNEAKRRKALDSRVGAAPGGHERENTKQKAHDAVREPSDGDAKRRRKTSEEATRLWLRMKVGDNWGTRIFYTTHLETTDAQLYPHRFICMEDTMSKKWSRLLSNKSPVLASEQDVQHYNKELEEFGFNNLPQDWPSKP
ncbi:hypothetical protein K438DRAFT_1787676 [Mycena galopus ATCC 62051]|nr:hypothetical protein K438DRAFT_1787676 [Mycena galopus ATCC 62051]